MSPEDVKARIKAAAPEGKLACAAAFRLAEELGISRKDLGEMLNESQDKNHPLSVGLLLIWPTCSVQFRLAAWDGL